MRSAGLAPPTFLFAKRPHFNHLAYIIHTSRLWDSFWSAVTFLILVDYREIRVFLISISVGRPIMQQPHPPTNRHAPGVTPRYL